jgi:hypothetical protein
LLCVDADRTNVLKVPLLIVEPKQKLIASAPDYVIPETAYDTIRASLIFDFNLKSEVTTRAASKSGGFETG